MENTKLNFSYLKISHENNTMIIYVDIWIFIA